MKVGQVSGVMIIIIIIIIIMRKILAWHLVQGLQGHVTMKTVDDKNKLSKK
jgi:hypothetical protein